MTSNLGEGVETVPLNRDAVRDTMPEFFDLLREGPQAAVRVMLGHFIFVYIHPYMDSNGHVGRYRRSRRVVPTFSHVILDTAGNLYGTTNLGGVYGNGTVFKLSPEGTSWTETVL